jgi:hypothetical protein
MSADLQTVRDNWETGQNPVFELSPDKYLTCVIVKYDDDACSIYRMYAYFKIGGTWQASCDVMDAAGEEGLLKCLEWVQRRMEN